MEQLTENNIFRVRKTTVFTPFWAGLSFLRYSCKSGFAIFAGRVTLNYAYSPFNYAELFNFQAELEWTSVHTDESPGTLFSSSTV